MLVYRWSITERAQILTGAIRGSYDVAQEIREREK